MDEEEKERKTNSVLKLKFMSGLIDRTEHPIDWTVLTEAHFYCDRSEDLCRVQFEHDVIRVIGSFYECK